MNPKTINEVAWIGHDYVKGKIRGVILTFHHVSPDPVPAFAPARAAE